MPYRWGGMLEKSVVSERDPRQVFKGLHGNEKNPTVTISSFN